MCVEVVHLTDPGQIVLACRRGEISEVGAIGALVLLGRTVRQARALLAA